MEAIKLLDNNSNTQKASSGPKTTSSPTADRTLRGGRSRPPASPAHRNFHVNGNAMPLHSPNNNENFEFLIR